MNLSDLRSQVKDYGYNDISDAEINAAINVAYLELCGADRWPFLEAGPDSLTIDTTTRYGSLSSLPSANSSSPRVIGVTYNGFELGAMSSDDYFAYAHSQSTVNVNQRPPTHFTIYGDKLYITRMADTNISVSVRYLKQPAALASTDSPIFPSRYHQLVVYGAVAVLAGEDDDDGVQSRFRGLLEKGLEQMKTDLLVKSEGRESFYSNPGSLNFWTTRLHSAGFPKVSVSDTYLLLVDTIMDVCSRYAWPFLRVDTSLTTTPGQAIVSLPSDCVRPLGLYLPAKGSQINYSSLADHRFDFHPSSTDTPGVPERYSIMPAAPGTSVFPQRNTRIVLWPAPDAAYSLKLLYERRIFPNVLDPNAALEWPGPGLLLEAGIIYRAAMRDPSKESQARVAPYKQEYEEQIERMRNDYMIEQRDRDPVVRITQTDLWDY